MYLTRKIMRALNGRLLSTPDGHRYEAEYARRIVAKWRKRNRSKRLTARVVQDALVETWNDLYGFKEWREVEVDLACAADQVVRRRHPVRSRKSQERPRRGWFG